MVDPGSTREEELMSPTRGNLEPAMIINELTNEKVPCMFNPYEYTISKQNQWAPGASKGLNCPIIEFKQGGAETLRLKLLFDTYTNGDASRNVLTHTKGLWTMMMVHEGGLFYSETAHKGAPPTCLFSWGGYEFRAVIISMTQTLTMFTIGGIPVRATVDITLQQYVDREAEQRSKTPGSGETPKTRPVQAGDRLDLIAWDEYGDCAKWRSIADANDLVDPLSLRSGQTLIVPPLRG